MCSKPASPLFYCFGILFLQKLSHPFSKLWQTSLLFDLFSKPALVCRNYYHRLWRHNLQISRIICRSWPITAENAHIVNNNKQLLDEVEHDIKNYSDRCHCYLPKRSWANNIDQGLNNSWYHAKNEFNNCFIIHWSIIKTYQYETFFKPSLICFCHTVYSSSSRLKLNML